jgi:hypothetical protein
MNTAIIAAASLAALTFTTSLTGVPGELIL